MKYQYRQLENWFKTDVGQCILEWEKSKVEPLIRHGLGDLALQIGLTQYSFIDQSPILNKQYIIPSDIYDISDPHCIYSPIYPLNFDENSVDLIILPHTLEFTDKIHLVIKDLYRILKEDGKVIITGFNPYSLWVLIQSLKKQYLPIYRAQMKSPKLLQIKLQHTGFCIHRGEFGLYTPLNKSIHQLHHPLNKMGDRWWPNLSGVYFISAQKQPPVITPSKDLSERIREKLQSPKALVPNSTCTHKTKN